MRPWAWLLVLLLVSTVVCVLAIPQVDIPETSYNEVDTPVNQAPPVVQGIKFVRPVVVPVVLSREAWEAGRIGEARHCAYDSVRKPLHRGAHSFQNLLCTFLI